MPFDHEIPDLPLYTTAMGRSLIDKLFFLDKLPDDVKVIVDFGCGDGLLISAIRSLCPDFISIGFDASPEMLEAARARNPGVTFTADWDEVRRICLEHRAAGRKCAINLSSVIHEARNYLNAAELAVFWSRVWGDAEFSFDAVIIRDMMVNRAASRDADPLVVARIQQVMRDPDQRRRLAQWQAKWGSLIENWSVLHFLLTYRYVANWDRELEENYLPMALEDFMADIPCRYVPTYREHFVLPFLRRQVRADFRINVPDATHLKLILERDTSW